MEATDGVLQSGLEYTHRICNAKGKKGMVLYKDTGDNRMLFVAHSALSNHNETLLSLFSRSISTEQLFNLVSLCYDYEHNTDYGAFKAVVLKLFGAKRPFVTTQIKKDLKNFLTDVELAQQGRHHILLLEVLLRRRTPKQHPNPRDICVCVFASACVCACP